MEIANKRYFDNSLAMQEVPFASVKAQYAHPSVQVEQEGDAYAIKATGKLVSLTQPERIKKIRIDMPTEFISGVIEGQHWFPIIPSLVYPYGAEETQLIAAHVYHGAFERHTFSIVPVAYRFGDDEFRIKVEYDPMLANAESILFCTDTDVSSYASINGVVAFNLGETGIHCLIMPIEYLLEPHRPFYGYSSEKLHMALATNLAAYLARHHVAAG